MINRAGRNSYFKNLSDTFIPTMIFGVVKTLT